MSEIKLSHAGAGRPALHGPSDDSRLDAETRDLLRMAQLLGPRDRAALSQIIRRAGEICEADGEETALAVLDQIAAILKGRLPDA